MTGTALETRREETLEAPTPTVIDVEARPIERDRPTQTAVLLNRGLALLSSVLRLALLWAENREQQAQRITPRRQAPPTQTSTERRTVASRGGRRQRHRHRGRTDT